MNNKMNRRGFFSAAAQIAGVTLVAPAFLSAVLGQSAQAQEKRRGAAPAGGGIPLVDPKDSVAKAVKYVEDYKKVPDAKGNHCKNCGFYVQKEARAGKEAGACTIFAGKLVLADAWCASWNKKA
ncbi:High-potential iron-sulfur protein [compost metagenome]